MDRLIWTPDQGLPDGARARDWLREQTRRERYRWLKFRHPNGRWRLRENAWGDLEWLLITPPTLINYVEVAYNAAGGSRASASISWLTGDVIVMLAGTEGSTTAIPSVGAATGLTLLSQQSNGTASTCCTRLSACVAGGNGSSAVTVTNSDTTEHWGFSVWVYRGSDGIGNSAEGHTTAKTVSQTNSAADSANVWGGFDFGANAVTNNNITPTPTNTDERAADGAHYTVYVADLTDQTGAGSVAYGVSGAGTISAFSKVVLEIKGHVVAGVALPPFRRNALRFVSRF